MSPSRGGPRGFTVIELLLVILIVGTMAGLSAPRFRGSYERLRLTESANALRNTIRMARELSITEGVSHRVSIDMVDRTYFLEKRTADGRLYERVQGKWGRVFRHVDGIEMASATEAIGFGPGGRVASSVPRNQEGPPGSSSARRQGGLEHEVTAIVLMNEMGESRSVLVDNITGRTWVEIGNRLRDGER